MGLQIQINFYQEKKTAPHREFLKVQSHFGAAIRFTDSVAQKSYWEGGA